LLSTCHRCQVAAAMPPKSKCTAQKSVLTQLLSAQKGRGCEESSEEEEEECRPAYTDAIGI